MTEIFRRLSRWRSGRATAVPSEETLYEDIKEPDGPYVISSMFYLTVILFVGVPMWFHTCTITRYPLPDLTSLKAQLDQPETTTARLHLDISLVSFHTNTDEQDDYLRKHLPKSMRTSIENATYNINWRVRRPLKEERDVFELHVAAHSGAEGSSPRALRRLEENLIRIHKPSNRFRLFMFVVEQQDYPAFCDPARSHDYTLSFERFVYLCPKYQPSSYSSMIVERAKTIENLANEVLEATYVNTISKHNFRHNLGSQVDLLFSLVPESPEAENLEPVFDIADKIHKAYDKNVRQTFPELRELFNIRPLTQNVFDLLDDKLLKKITRKTTEKASTNDSNTEKPSRILEKGRMRDLFQGFESRLNRHSSQNVYNVLCIIPNPKGHSIAFRQKVQEDKLEILEGQDFYSILILTDDRSLVLQMRAILRKLIGLSEVNLCQSCIVRRDVFFNRWELDVVMGALTIAKLHDTLVSLESIGQQVVGVKIPKEVSEKAKEAHEAAMKSIELLRTGDGAGSFRLSSRAFEISESAFYDPSLLESLYFPDDLKWGIYAPLFAPLAPVIITSAHGLVRYIFKSFFKIKKLGKVKIN